MKVQFRHPAPGVLDHNIGKRYPAGTLVAADVVEGGKAILLTFDVPDEHVGRVVEP